MVNLLRVYRDAFTGLPPAVWWLCAVAFVNRAGTMVVPFLMLWFTVELEFSVADAGWLMVWFGVGSIAGSWGGGQLVDRMGGLAVQVLTLCLQGAAFLVLGEMRSFESLAVLLALVGMFGDAFRPASFAMLASNCPTALRAKGFALLRLAVNLGWAIGPTVGGFVAETDYSWLFRLDGMSCGLAAIVLVAVRKRISQAAVHEETAVADRHPFRDGRFLICGALALILATVFMQFMFTMPLYFKNSYGLDEHEIGLLFAINAVVIVLVEMVLVHTLRGRRPLSLVSLGAALIGCSFGIAACGSNLGVGIAVVIVWTLGEMLESPQIMVWTSARAGPRSRGKYMAFMSAMWSTASLVAPWVGASVYASHGPEVLWIGCFAAGSIAALGFFTIDRRERAAGR